MASRIDKRFCCLRNVLSFLLLCCFHIEALSQETILKFFKPVIDSSVYHKWPIAELPRSCLSNDGKYVQYVITNKPFGGHTLVIQSVTGKWKMEVPNASIGSFTSDSRIIVFKQADDRLAIVTLGSSYIKHFADVRSFRLSASGNWLAFQTTGKTQLTLENLSTSRQYSFWAVSDYVFSELGDVLVLQEKIDDEQYAVQYLALPKMQIKTIWTGNKPTGFCIDKEAAQLIFFSKQYADNHSITQLWHYRFGSDTAKLLIDDLSKDIDAGLVIDQNFSCKFSNDGEGIFFGLKSRQNKEAAEDALQVDIWSYHDSKLQSQQLKDNAIKTYLAKVRISDKRIIRLQYEDEDIGNTYFNFEEGESNDDFLLVINRKGHEFEWNWNKDARSTVYVVSTNDGSRKVISNNVPSVPSILSYILSPTGKYVIFFDLEKDDYLSYCISSGISVNLTKGIKATWSQNDLYDCPVPFFLYNLSVAGWLEKDSGVLIYDQSDIWLFDPAGVRSPNNLTMSYGKKHDLMFTLATDYSTKPIGKSERIVLNAFNRINKDNGYYEITMGEKKGPKKLTMGPYTYNGSDGLEVSRFMPIKASGADCYIIRRMSATDSENFFVTKDFKNFSPVSDNYPEKKYNWLTSELVTWKSLEGRAVQGILYKPENFDSTKRYPLIFHCYERFSETLNAFHLPGPSDARINIPFFVSNGYLVFVPDIHYKIGEPGRSALSSILSAAMHLKTKRWIDAKSMGIHGHSFGGFETNYIVTHTDLFAAAMSSAGMSDFISCYGSVIGDGSSRQRQYELYRDRIGASLWQNTDLYLRNSPVLRADKVNTPLLMMNNKADGDVPFAQGVEMFTALRRLGKKVWMLQYDGENHSAGGRAAEDLTIRTKQFFDHFLKDSLPPKWMTRGVPAKLKGIDDGLELDDEIKTPGQGLLTEEEKKKVETLKHRKPSTITVE
jgi:dipeptidyl aminopeptidase/acylaminoacyl peptidase